MLVLSTVHQAKGLEWSHVFVIRLIEDSFPHRRALEETGGEEEERRIFYVAVSRAMNELTLTYPSTITRGGYGPMVFTTPSRFLTEIDDDLFERAELEHEFERLDDDEDDDGSAASARAPAAVAQAAVVTRLPAERSDRHELESRSVRLAPASPSWLGVWLCRRTSRPGTRQAQPANVRPFRIEVVDDETGRGVPLVELRTVNQIRYVTDSNGIVAFDEPGLLGQKVFFHVKSHGYEYPKDGFGNRGVALETQAGRIGPDQDQAAQHRPAALPGDRERESIATACSPATSVPIAEPLLNGQVLGQDSVVTAVFGGKIHWFWGDTNRPGYPLGNFHVPGATSELPGQGGLDPSRGVNLSYFVDKDGFARPTCEMPGPGPTWITGLVVLRDRQGKERMFANYVKIRPPMETYQRGLVEFDAETRTFRKRAEFPMDLAAYAGEHPGGHPFLHRDGGVDYIYYCSPYPLVRVPADPEALADPASLGGVHLPGAGNPARSAEARSRPGRQPALRLEEANAARLAGTAGQARRPRAGSRRTRRCSTSATSSPASACWPTADRSTGTPTAAAG